MISTITPLTPVEEVHRPPATGPRSTDQQYHNIHENNVHVDDRGYHGASRRVADDNLISILLLNGSVSISQPAPSTQVVSHPCFLSLRLSHTFTLLRLSYTHPVLLSSSPSSHLVRSLPCEIRLSFPSRVWTPRKSPTPTLFESPKGCSPPAPNVKKIKKRPLLMTQTVRARIVM